MEKLVISHASTGIVSLGPLALRPAVVFGSGHRRSRVRAVPRLTAWAEATLETATSHSSTQRDEVNGFDMIPTSR